MADNGIEQKQTPQAPTRPVTLPRCEHGNSPRWCNKCQARDARIQEIVKPLVDEFWEHRGARDLSHLMLRAYRMGMKEAEEKYNG